MQDFVADNRCDVTKTVPVVLIGYDANGLTVKKSATITLKAPIVRPDDSTTGNPGTGGLR